MANYLGDHDFTNATVTGISGGVGEGMFATVWDDPSGSRTSRATDGSGAISNNANGVFIDTSSTINSSARIKYDGGFAWDELFAVNSKLSARWLRNVSTGTTGDFFIGCGTPSVTGSGGGVFTTRQYGFKVIRAASADTYSATNGDGTTETASSFTPTAGITVYGNYYAEKTGATDIKYYESNVLRATHTTNLPADSGANSPIQVYCSNNGQAQRTAFYISSMSFSWEGAV